MSARKEDVSGKVILITGASAGIGKFTAEGLAQRGAHVVMGCRNLAKAQMIVEELKVNLRAKGVASPSFELLEMDLNDLESVKRAAQTFKEKHSRLDVLINNAGVVTQAYSESKQGYETMFATNHLGHFYLTLELLDVLKASQPARVINVSSDGHRLARLEIDKLLDPSRKGKPFGMLDSVRYYGHTKTCNILFSKALSTRFEQENINITVNSLHPGAVDTEIGRETPCFLACIMRPFVKLFFKSSEQGARTSVYLASSSEVEGITDKYFVDCKVVEAADYARDAELAEKLWAFSLELLPKKE